MNGREQRDQLINTRTENKLKDLPQCVSEWYYNLLASGMTSNSCNDYVNKVHHFFVTNKITNVDQINQLMVDKYFISIKTKTLDDEIVATSDSYQQTTWCALNRFFSFLLNRDYISKNYMLQITKPKNKDLERINEHRILLTKKDFQKIIEAARNGRVYANRLRNEVILTLLMTTGMRIAALVNINVEDIDFKTQTLTIIDKGVKRHQYFLSNKVAELLSDYIEQRDRYALFDERGLLISKETCKRMSLESVKDVVKRCTKQALGRELSPHKLRAGFCSILYKETHDIEFVRRAVGHSDVKTTQRYISVDNTEKKKASQIMDSIF